jgi:hypothetical protein
LHCTDVLLEQPRAVSDHILAIDHDHIVLSYDGDAHGYPLGNRNTGSL